MHICRQAGDGDAEEFVRLTTIFAPTGLTAAQLTEILMNNMEFQEFGINNFTITRFGQLVITVKPRLSKQLCSQNSVLCSDK